MSSLLTTRLQGLRAHRLSWQKQTPGYESHGLLKMSMYRHSGLDCSNQPADAVLQGNVAGGWAIPASLPLEGGCLHVQDLQSAERMAMNDALQASSQALGRSPCAWQMAVKPCCRTI